MIILVKLSKLIKNKKHILINFKRYKELNIETKIALINKSGKKLKQLLRFKI